MATSDFSMECYVVSVPAEYIQSVTLETVILNSELCQFSLGPNSLMINNNSRIKLGLDFKSQSNLIWGIITFHLKYQPLPMKNCEIFASKRLVQLIIDERVSGNDIVISEDLLFNMDSGRRRKNEESIQRKGTYLKLTNDHQCDVVLPVKASKVGISVYQTAYPLDNSIIDQTLQRYFSYPRYLCVGDVFSIYLRDHMFDFISNIDIIHFKVCNLQGLSCSDSSEESGIGYFVDSSVTIYQVSNCQDFFPYKQFPILYKPNLSTLLSDEETMTNLKLYHHHLLPNSFISVFEKCCSWVLPFLYKSKAVKEVGLIPIFILFGQNGAGKTQLLQALSWYFGMNYWRLDCVSVSCAIPGQTEAKLNTILNKLKNVAPCILHLSNFEALYQDAEAKEDVRVMNYFEQEVKKLESKWPVVIFVTTNNCKNISSNINHLFLDTVLLSVPSCEQRESIILWLIGCQNGSIKKNELQYVASQTSGFVFRDLQTLVGLAFKEKCKRCKGEKEGKNEFLLTDFSKVIEMMHKEYSESVGAPKVPSVSWKDVGALEPLKKEILSSLRSNMFTTGLKRSGLLLHGPPGTGKTLLAKAVATQCGRNFLSVKGPELLNMYVGQSEQNVRDLFELAKVASPSIIFFDELDSLAPNRGRSGDSGGVMDRVVSQLLAEMDELSTSGDVFILGATNRPDLIDPALLRPGRLDKLLYVGPCEDRSSQLSVITALTHKLCLGQDVSLQEVVSLLPLSVSGAQIAALCSTAWLSSARQTILSGKHQTNSPVRVQQEHFFSALKELFKQH